MHFTIFVFIFVVCICIDKIRPLVSLGFVLVLNVSRRSCVLGFISCLTFCNRWHNVVVILQKRQICSTTVRSVIASLLQKIHKQDHRMNK